MAMIEFDMAMIESDMAMIEFDLVRLRRYFAGCAVYEVIGHEKYLK